MNMILKNKLEDISLDETGIIITSKKNKSKKILFSDLDGIYITVKKTKPLYESALIAISVCIASYSYFILQTNIILTLSLLLLLSFFIKMSTFKRYGVKICLRGGEYMEMQIPANSKHVTIDIVNDIRKEIYNYKIKKSNESVLAY